MVTLLLDSTQLEVVLSGTERALSFRRSNIRIDRSSIVRVQLTDDPWTWLRGVVSPGSHVPGVIAMGTWKSVAGLDFVLIRGRKPGVVIDVQDHEEFQRLAFTTRHGVALVQALRLDAGDEPEDVATLAPQPS